MIIQSIRNSHQAVWLRLQGYNQRQRTAIKHNIPTFHAWTHRVGYTLQNDAGLTFMSSSLKLIETWILVLDAFHLIRSHPKFSWRVQFKFERVLTSCSVNMGITGRIVLIILWPRVLCWRVGLCGGVMAMLFSVVLRSVLCCASVVRCMEASCKAIDRSSLRRILTRHAEARGYPRNDNLLSGIVCAFFASSVVPVLPSASAASAVLILTWNGETKKESF